MIFVILKIGTFDFHTDLIFRQWEFMDGLYI
jgi:hypothetical protein